jgi:hypothetical protein
MLNQETSTKSFSGLDDAKSLLCPLQLKGHAPAVPSFTSNLADWFGAYWIATTCFGRVDWKTAKSVGAWKSAALGSRLKRCWRACNRAEARVRRGACQVNPVFRRAPDLTR